MNLYKIKLEWVSLDDITPIYVEAVPQAPLEKMVRTLEQGKCLSNYIILEKRHEEKRYWLVAGFLEYRAYCQLRERGARVSQIPCVVKPCSGETEQRLQLLSHMFRRSIAKWMDKHIIIQQMVCKGDTTAAIAKELGVLESDIKRYLVHPDIPQDIIEQAYRNQGSFITLEQIRNLKLQSSLAEQLYWLAVLPKRHPNRLTTDKLQKIKWLAAREGFYDLGEGDQWEMLSDALCYRGILEDAWDRKIQQKLKRRGSAISGLFTSKYSEHYSSFINH